MMQKFKDNISLIFNTIMLTLLPLVDIIHTALPELQQYLTSTTYKFVGLIVVVTNIFIHLRTKVKPDDSISKVPKE